MQEIEYKQSFQDAQECPSNNIKNEMPTEEDARSRRGHRPGWYDPHQELGQLAVVVVLDPAAGGRDGAVEEKNAAEGGGGEAEEGGDEEDPGGVATGKGPVVDGEGEAHALVVDRTGAADEVLDEANEEEVEEGTEKKAKEEGVGGARGGGEGKEGDGDGEPEAAVAGDLEGFEEGAGNGATEGVDAEGQGGVERDQPAEDGRTGSDNRGGRGRRSVGSHRLGSREGFWILSSQTGRAESCRWARTHGPSSWLVRFS